MGSGGGGMDFVPRRGCCDGLDGDEPGSDFGRQVSDFGRLDFVTVFLDASKVHRSFGAKNAPQDDKNGLSV